MTQRRLRPEQGGKFMGPVGDPTKDARTASDLGHKTFMQSLGIVAEQMRVAILLSQSTYRYDVYRRGELVGFIPVLMVRCMRPSLVEARKIIERVIEKGAPDKPVHGSGEGAWHEVVWWEYSRELATWIPPPPSGTSPAPSSGAP